MKQTLLLALLILLWLPGCQSDPIASRDEFYQSGQEYLRQGKFAEASIQFQNVLAADDTYVPGYLALAETREKMRDVEAVVIVLRSLLETEPENVRAKLWLGKYYLAGGQLESSLFEEARRQAQEVLDIEPDNVEAMILLGNSYAGLQDFERSAEALDEALKTDPGNLQAYLGLGASRFRGDREAEAERVFLEAVARHPDSARAHVGLGGFYIFSRQFGKAEVSLNSAFDLAPNSRIALYSLIALHLTSGESEKVEALFDRAIEAGADPLPLQLSRADLRIYQGQVAEGIALLRELRKEHPDNREVSLRLARTLLNRGDREEGSAIVSAVLEANPRDAEAHYFMGVVRISEEELEAGLEELDRALQLDPYLAPAHLSKANVLHRKGRLQEAEETLQALLEFDRNNLMARARLAKIQILQGGSATTIENLLSEAEAILERVPSSFDALAARAEASLLLNRLADAKRDYQQLLERQEQNPFFLNRLARIADLEGKPNQAVRYYRQVLEIFADPDAINQLAAILVREGRQGQALRELDRLAAQTDQDFLIHMVKGRVYVSQERYSEAEKAFRKSIELDPDNYPGYIGLAQLSVAQNNWEQAIREVDVLLSRNDRYAPAYMQKASYLEALERPAAALENYRKALELFPEDSDEYASAANNLAWLSVRAGGNLNEALGLAQQARRHDPQNANYADTLGWIYYQMGSYTLAVDQLLYGVNYGTPQPGNYYRLGMAYFKKGDAAHAGQALRKSLEMDSEFEGADEARAMLEEIG